MAGETCPDCGRPIALSYEAWMAHKSPDDEHLSCLAHVAYSEEDLWGDESIPECQMATIARLRASEGRLKAKLAAAEAALAAADEMRSWYAKQMYPDGPEVAFDSARAAYEATK